MEDRRGEVKLLHRVGKVGIDIILRVFPYDTRVRTAGTFPHGASFACVRSLRSSFYQMFIFNFFPRVENRKKNIMAVLLSGYFNLVDSTPECFDAITDVGGGGGQVGRRPWTRGSGLLADADF